MSETTPIKVDVWSDIACPWCYIGKRKFESAVTESGIPVGIEYHAYELAPDLPEEFEGSEQDYLEIRGYSADEVQPLLTRLVGAAKAVGLDFDYDILRHTNMLKGHQLIRWAQTEGRQLDMVERILAAHFEEGRHVGRDEDLADLAAEIGLDREKALQALKENRFREDVRADELLARQLGIRGVPYYVFDDTYGVSGAQDPSTFADILRQLAQRKVVEE
ncbi:DsbA family oxidoreductase [Herbiconiux ginsengi]|uniref:Predicted dithiol-disulfide isomerase, DsbA family n=1 Tax=Herbiconiux ginsengi TaxID=381665 RepID=A0A1H3S4J9_9MICO|nr:DsbA family oxidoreductase [Herbiconiux ginsengi]SDZ32411.1 Predicted dithiol-disulfide isomerase, DsbA family [Herbiconiux ginsengi]